MTMNPNERGSTRSWTEHGFTSVEEAEVLTVPTHTSSDSVGHVVEVDADVFSEPQIVQVAASTTGDVELPAEGDTVLVGYRDDGNPQVLGTQYTDGSNVPVFEAGERVVGHPATSTEIRFQTDGTVHVEVENGPTLDLQPNGDVVIDSGSTRPVTEVDFVNETVTRASNVYLNSN